MHRPMTSRPALLALLGAALLLLPPPQAKAADPNVLVPQAGIGAKFGSRDPFRCTSKVAPATGLITPQLAAQYVVCQSEKLNHIGWLFLVNNVRVEVGSPLSHAAVIDLMITDGQQGGPVLPIRGSFDNYLCSPLDATTPPGHNCALWHETHATGHCYRTAFGDWSCHMSDLNAQQVPNQPPPR